VTGPGDDRPRAAGPHNPFPDLHGPTPEVADAIRAEAAAQARRVAHPTCLFCGHDQFTEEVGKLDTRWGMEAHKVRMLICNRCAFTMHFSMGRGVNV